MPTKRREGKKKIKINLETCSLKDIDKALSEAIENDKNNWWRYFQLIDAVERRKLFAPEYHSATAWLKDFCSKNKDLPLNRAYQIKRAGKVYHEYQERNPEAIPLEEVEASPEYLSNLEQASTIRYGNVMATQKQRERYIDKYMPKVLSGKWKRKEVRGLLASEKKQKAARLDARDEASKEMTDQEMEELEKKAARNTEATDKIKEALRTYHFWIGEKKTPAINMHRTASTQDYYKMFPEFDLPPAEGTGKSKQTADGVVCENLSTPTGYDANTHLFEIKVSKHDFERDYKMLDYRRYSDQAWLAVPEDLLLEIDPEEVPKVMGILAYREQTPLPRIKEIDGRFVREEWQVGLPAPGDNPNLMISQYPNEQNAKKGILYIVRNAEINEEPEVDILLRRFILRDR